MKIKLTVLVLALCLVKVCCAQQADNTNFDLATSYIENQCDFDKVISKGLNFDKWFFEYDKYITEKALIACRAIFNDKTETPDITEYWPDDVRKEILHINLSEIYSQFSLSDDKPFQTLAKNYNDWRAVPTLPIIKNNIPLPASIASQGADLARVYYLSTASGLPRAKSDMFKITSEQNTYCSSRFSGASDCVEVFDAFNKINRKLSVFQRLDVVQKHNAYVALQVAKWDKYSENSRFQTFIDVAFTSWVYRKHFSRADDLITPPPLQWFALRPSLVIEHLSDAPNGNRDEPALALEWIGINAWDMKLPLGVSVTSVYADRATGKSVGHGLTFHVNNSFSFGFASRGGGDNSIYFNIEFLDWAGAKQDKLKAYRGFIKN